ncbi:hypothetical protein ACEOHC_003915 [Salmonella enterica]
MARKPKHPLCCVVRVKMDIQKKDKYATRLNKLISHHLHQQQQQGERGHTELIERAMTKVRRTPAWLSHVDWVQTGGRAQNNQKGEAHKINVYLGEIYRELGLKKKLRVTIADEVRRIIVKHATLAAMVDEVRQLPAYIQHRERLENERRIQEAARQQRIKEDAERRARAAAQRKAQRLKDYRSAKSHRAKMKFWGTIDTRTVIHYDTPITRLQKAISFDFAQRVHHAIRVNESWRRKREEEAEAIRVQEQREKDRAKRLRLLDVEVYREEVGEHVQALPMEQRLGFRRWYMKRGENRRIDPADVVAAYLAEVYPAPVVAVIEPEAPEANSVAILTGSATVLPFVAPAPAQAAKRKGNRTSIESRPDQAAFSRSVEHNSYHACLVTGSRVHSRCSAAHLLEHSADGPDHHTNGIWVRWDIHMMMDRGECAIHPETLKIWFCPEALMLDEDLQQWHGKQLGPTVEPINPAYLAHRWNAFIEKYGLAIAN